MELPAAALDVASKRSLSRYHSGLKEKHTIAQKYPPLPTITEENEKKKKLAYIWHCGTGLYLTALCVRPSVEFVYTVKHQIHPICHPSPTSMILK